MPPIHSFDVKEEDGGLYLLLPPVEDLDAALGTSKVRARSPRLSRTFRPPETDPLPRLVSNSQWMVTQAASEVIGRGGATAIIDGSIELVGPEDQHNKASCSGSGGNEGAVLCGGGGGGGKLDW